MLGTALVIARQSACSAGLVCTSGTASVSSQVCQCPHSEHGAGMQHKPILKHREQGPQHSTPHLQSHADTDTLLVHVHGHISKAHLWEWNAACLELACGLSGLLHLPACCLSQAAHQQSLPGTCQGRAGLLTGA